MIIPVFRPMDGADRAKYILDPVPQHQLIVGHIADAHGRSFDLGIFRIAKRLVVQRIDQQGRDFRPHQAAGNAKDVPPGRCIPVSYNFRSLGIDSSGKTSKIFFPI